MTDALVRAVGEGLETISRRYDAEQALQGIDALDELQHHELIGDTLRRCGLGAWSEQRYPADRQLPHRNTGRRCDLVLTPDRLPLLDPRDAFWLEVKSVAQFTPAGPSRHYGSRLLGPVVADIAKMAADPGIAHGGLLLLLFTADQATARHDLAVWRVHCLKQSLPLASPGLFGFGLNDRLGNAYASVALFPVISLPPLPTP